jgi:hypothetical protein
VTPTTAPSLQLRIELKDALSQVRRMGAAYRNKKDAPEFVAAETSALFHLIEAQRLMEKL